MQEQELNHSGTSIEISFFERVIYTQNGKFQSGKRILPVNRSVPGSISGNGPYLPDAAAESL